MDTQHCFLKEEFCFHDCIAITPITSVLVWILLKAEHEARTWVEGVHLGGDPRKQEGGSGNSGAGEKGKPV